jgi:hypothetical protein
MRWFALDGAVLGYVTGHPRGCYRVPGGAAPPEAATATGAVPHEAGEVEDGRSRLEGSTAMGNAGAAGAADGLIEEDG